MQNNEEIKSAVFTEFEKVLISTIEKNFEEIEENCIKLM